MKPRDLILISILILYSLSASPLCRAGGAQNGFTFTGHIKFGVPSQASIPHFSIKLYPPKISRKPILMTTTDNSGNFQFKGLSERSYLLEIYLGDNMVYQDIIQLNDNICCEIYLNGNSSNKTCPCPKPAARRRR